MSEKFLNGIDLASTPIDNILDAVSAQQPVSLAQLQASIEGRKNKDAVRGIATSNITLAGLQTIDGISLVAGDREGVVAQTAGPDNGIYIVSSGAWSRSIDANTASEIENMEFSVLEGSSAGKKYLNTNKIGTVTLGTTALTFINSGSGGSSYSAGFGIDAASLSSGVIAVEIGTIARKATAIIGNGSATSIAVTHGFSTKDVTWSLRDTSTDSFVSTTAVATSTSVITFTFATAPSTGAYEVTVTG